MKVNKETANEIWRIFFGLNDVAYDPFGRQMSRNQHGTGNQGSWEVDHIWPQNPDGNLSGGANTYENAQPLADASNQEKANKLQGKVNDITFAIHRIQRTPHGVVGRMAIKDEDDEWVWAYG